MTPPEIEYKIPAQLLQSIINNLEEQPARSTRGLLNQLEGLVTRQQEEAVAAVEAAKAESKQS